jgi:signal peptidase I
VVLAVAFIAVLAEACSAGDPFTLELSSSAMESAIHEDALITVDPDAYASAPIERFDIILYRRIHPDGSLSEHVHRVLGLEGEEFEYDGFDYLVVSNELVEEPLTVQQPTDWIGQLTIPDDHVFAMGDNRPASRHEDSRASGPVAYSDIVGKVVSFDSRDWVGKTGGTMSG